MATNWKTLKLTGDPILVIGLRPRTKIDGYRVVVDRNLHPALGKLAEDAVQEVARRTPIAFSPYIDLGEEEYLSLDPATLTITADRDGSNPSQRQQTARLLEMVGNADTLPTLGAGTVISRLDEFVLQAVCFHIGRQLIGFVTHGNARQIIKRSAIPLGKDDKTDRFKSITRPELVLEGDVHAIVAPKEIAILNKPQFQFLVGDIGLVAQYVPAQVSRIAARLKTRGVVMSAATNKALEDKAVASVQVARRLDAFLERIDQVDISRISSGAGFTAQDLRKQDFVNAKGEIECEPARVVELLDALEGRFFGDAFSTEKRRADRFRRRA